jgi:hypothetical protein
VDAVASGAIVVRKRSDGPPTWRRWSEMPDGVTGVASTHIERAFAGNELLAGLGPPEQLLDVLVTLPTDHLLDQRLAYGDGGYGVEWTVMRMREGVGVRCLVDARMVPLLMRLHEPIPLRTAVSDLHDVLGGDLEDVTDLALRTVRDLLEVGLLGARWR